MKKASVLLSLAFVLSLSGCALLSSVLPPQIDDQGNAIAGTHQATPAQQAAAGLLPYGLGSVLLNGVLFVMNSVEKYKAKKVGAGLISTVSAINKIKDDPSLTAQWEKIKDILKNEHTIDGVQSVIQKYLEKA
ncbi:MAG: hypothetical protein WC547_09695 [Candidatus Omnitrophota bacterium]